MIYLHVPFCRSFCTYCGFYSELSEKGCGQGFEAYGDAVCQEAASRRDEIAATLSVNTLYIGGGTPSVLPPSVLSRIVEALPYGPYEEFTLEANPDDVTASALSLWKSLGVNRLSMGVQSFDDSLLRWMNRRHDAAGALRAFSLAREAGFGNISIDLIFGVDGFPSWEESVRRAVSLRPEHISAYQLSVEDGSALSDMVAAGRYAEAQEELCRAQYDMLCRLLGEAGYVHYEVSNFALPGYEAVHNSAYWKRVPYVGLGPAAHSFDGKRRRWNTASLTYTSEDEVLTQEDIRVETIMLGLRTARGVDYGLVAGEACDRLLAEGALVRCGGTVRIPEDRFFVSDDIIRQLI